MLLDEDEEEEDELDDELDEEDDDELDEEDDDEDDEVPVLFVSARDGSVTPCSIREVLFASISSDDVLDFIPDLQELISAGFTSSKSIVFNTDPSTVIVVSGL